MSQERRYYVYILASRSRILYVGMTGALMLSLEEISNLAHYSPEHRASLVRRNGSLKKVFSSELYGFLKKLPHHRGFDRKQ